MSKFLRSSRRGFLKGMSVLSASSVLTLSRSALAEPADVCHTNYAWETAPSPIPASNITETVVADVAVVGGGASGFCAALSACQAGAKTVLLQKGPIPFTYGENIGVIGSRMQEAAGIHFDPAEVIGYLMRFAHNKPNPKLLWLWAAKGGGTVDWIEGLMTEAGVKMSLVTVQDDPLIQEKQYSTGHRVAGGMMGMIRVMEHECIQAGVDIRYNTPAVQLVRQNADRVSGVVCRSNNGQYKLFQTRKGVVLCTGDYGNDTEMMEKYCNWAVGIRNVRQPASCSQGDGHKMALWVGAEMDQAPHAPMIHCAAENNEGTAPYADSPFLAVNIYGERFHNEDVSIPFESNANVQQPGKRHWQIMDADWSEQVTKLGGGWGRYNGPGGVFGTQEQMDTAVKRGAAVQANTIEELAVRMKASPEILKATVARYNELAKKGKDEDFGKAATRVIALEKPPFYACKRVSAILAIAGGVKVDTQMQVLDTQGQVIPGLYAAGNVAGSFFSVDYPMIVGGLSLGRATTFGRLAGQSAARTIA